MVIGIVKLEMHVFAIMWSYDRWVTWLEGCGRLNWSHTLLKLVAIVLTKVEFIRRLHDQWVPWLGGWDSVTLNQRGYNKNKKRGKLVLEMEAAFFYYKLRQLGYYKLGWLLQIRTTVITKYCKAAITNWGKIYYK